MSERHLQTAAFLSLLVGRIFELLVEPGELTDLRARGKDEATALATQQREGQAVAIVGDFEIVWNQIAVEAALLPLRSLRASAGSAVKARSADISCALGLHGLRLRAPPSVL